MMKLETERLILRDLKESDAKSLKVNIDNKKVCQYLLVVPYPYSMKDAKWFINHCKKAAKEKSRKSYELGIQLKTKSDIIGVVGLTHVDSFQGTAEIGCWLAEKYWRQGIMKEAMTIMINFAFNKLKLRRIDTYAFEENIASNSLIKKLGFVFEGCRVKKAVSRATGKIHNDNGYGMLKEEWKK